MNKIQVSGEKKLTLLLLFWFFGLLSIHRFYTGKYLTGGLQLLTLVLTGVLVHLRIEILSVISGGLLFLWLMVDFMHIIIGKFTDKEGRPIIDWV
jgi:TM2 domain-containing membrane protein YozV